MRQGRRILAGLLWLLVCQPATRAHAWFAPICEIDGPLTGVASFELPEPVGLRCPAPPTEIEPGATVPPDDGIARHAYARYSALRDAGRLDEALLHLGVVEAGAPRIADLVALWRAELLVELGDPAAACGAYAAALASPVRPVQIRAEVGTVRCRILADDAGAAAALAQLSTRYRHLPELVALRLELGAMFERRDETARAVQTYRAIDLDRPGSNEAAAARDRLEGLAAHGVPVPRLSAEQRVARAETLVRQGPMTQARTEIAALLADAPALPATLGPRVALVAGLMARFEGRWDDADRYFREARTGRTWSTEDMTQLAARAQEAAAVASARSVELARATVERLAGRRPYASLTTAQLLIVVREGTRAGMKAHVDGALGALAAKRQLPPQMAFDAAIQASGFADDAHVAALLEKLVDLRALGVAARYHRARALERLGRAEEALAEYREVVARDDGYTPYYAMWSAQRLPVVEEAIRCACVPTEPEDRVAGPSREANGSPAASGSREANGRDDADAGRVESAGGPLLLASLNELPDPDPTPARTPVRLEGKVTPELLARLAPVAEAAGGPDPKALAAELEPVAAEYAEAFPWFARAVDLLRMGLLEPADEELHEAYLAWRRAKGRPLSYVGLESLYRGDTVVRRPVPMPLLRARGALSAEARQTLGRVASALGDEGVSVGFTGLQNASGGRPRAYELAVNRAARRYGLDPNLLLAVMRVESVYQRRIISYAGAVGLMQIMPRTGWLIANKLGREDFTTDDLLDPETNVEFAAWYLSSLIQRFEGRLPLAIASYNGGPHNVRKWLRQNAATMPLDAFLERIPFSQTHRYVRRVLTHYAAYRAQQSLPMETLSLRLPPAEREDPVAF